MDSLRILVALAGLALVFAASLAAREPIRHPRRTTGSHDSEAGRILHRGLTIHIAVTLAACAGVVASPTLGAGGFTFFLIGLALLRFLGFAAGSRHPRLVRYVHPILAPTEGAALLIDWLLTPLFRRARELQTVPDDRKSAHAQVLDLTRTTVEKVMIPRSEVVWMRSSAGIEEITETVHRRPHSRYPVFAGDAEQLIGMLGLFDLLGPLSLGSTAESLARPAMVIPETMGCDLLLEKMRAERFDTAVVIDEFGAIAGLVTLEDLLEVIVGELTGEHETVPVRVRRMDDGTYLVDGALRIDEFEDLFGIALPEGDYETVAGLFLSRTFRIPGPGEKLVLDGVRLEVAEATATRIRTLHVIFAVDAREPMVTG